VRGLAERERRENENERKKMNFQRLAGFYTMFLPMESPTDY
jgi:hypothetical protein